MYVATLAFFFWIETMNYSNIASYSAVVYIALLNAPIEVGVIQIERGSYIHLFRFLRHPAWETKKNLKHVRSTELNAWPELGYRVTSAISVHNKGLDYVCNESWMWPMSMVCPKNDSTFNSFPQCTGSHAVDQTDFLLIIFLFLNNNEPYFSMSCPWGNVRSAKRQRRCT